MEDGIDEMCSCKLTHNGAVHTEHTYGFQGQMNDNEIKGNGNSINYKYRMHDPRLGRFFAVDPLTFSYPWNSPYAFSENRVTNAVELEGLEAWDLGGGVVVNGPFKNAAAAKSGALSGMGSVSINGFTVTAPKPIQAGGNLAAIRASISGEIPISTPVESVPDPNMTYEEYTQQLYESGSSELDAQERDQRKFEETFNVVHQEVDNVSQYTSVDDYMVLRYGVHTNNTKASLGDKVLAGTFILIPFISGGGARGVKAILTNPQAKKIANEMGWGEKLAHGNIPDAVRDATKGNDVYFDKSTKSYFSPDKTGHRADNAWKKFKKDGSRETGVFIDGVFKKVSK